MNVVRYLLGALKYEDGKVRTATAVDADTFAGPVVSPNTKCLRWLKTASSTIQDVDFDGSLVPLSTNMPLMLQSWYKKTAQSPVNTVVSFSWHSGLP